MDGPVIMLVNPIAGGGRAPLFAAAIEASLVQRGHRVVRWTARPLEAPSDLFREAAAVVAVGGDGTVRDAVAAIMRSAGAWPAGNCDVRQASCPPVLVVPAGTANLLAGQLNIMCPNPAAVGDLAAALDGGRRVLVDVADAGGRVCLMMASAGIDAAVVHMLDAARRGPIRRADYVPMLARALRTYDYPPLRVMADGTCIFAGEPAMALAGNIAGYGAGFSITPLARCDDGLLDVCVMPCASPEQIMRMTMLAAAGAHVGSEGVVYARARRVRIESSRPCPVQVDGDPAGFTPFDVYLPGCRAAFIVPAETGWPPGPAGA